MSRVNSLNFSANRNIRKPFPYEREPGFSAPYRPNASPKSLRKRSRIRIIIELTESSRQWLLFLNRNFQLEHLRIYTV